MYKSALGQDSHRFEPDNSAKPLVLAGVSIPGCPGLVGNSDADVVLHAVTNAISGITGVNIIGKTADDMCLGEGITDSAEYLKKALEHMGTHTLTHVSISLEASRPKLADHIQSMKESLATLLSLSAGDIGVTATSGEGMTAFGRGEGIAVLAIVSVERG